MPGFPANARLRRPEDFKAVLRYGRRLSESALTAVVRPGQGPSARLGFAIAARQVPTAVARNRIKRHVRESFRMNRERLPCIDIVVLARGDAGGTRGPELRAAMDRIWKKVCDSFPAGS